MNDEASHNRNQWLAISDISVLHPEDYIDIGTKISLDERNGFDRRDSAKEHPENNTLRKKNRRAPETKDTIKRRQFHALLMKKFREQRSPILWPLLSIAGLLIFVIANAIISPTLLPVSQMNCNAAPDIAVNWNNCLKPNLQLANAKMNNAQLRSARLPRSNLTNSILTSADIAYADLSFSTLGYAQLQNANLVGANLEQSDLSNANLTNADLSYANLLNANLEGAILDNVSFDHAIWPNGDICTVQSVGQCLRTQR